MSIEKTIEKLALKNAVKYDGKANPNAIIGGVLGAHPEARKDVDKIRPLIQKIVDKINKLSLKDQETLLNKIEPRKENIVKSKEKLLKDMDNAKKGKVIMRFEPSPSGPMHIGHSYSLSLNLELAKKYAGKLILRISDTNPENIYPPAYEQLPKDADWLTNNSISEVMVQSDRLELYYSYAETLLKKGNAYICNCDPESYKALITKCKPCPCRNLSPDEQLGRWQHMLSDWKAGDAVMRIKTDITHKNPAMRDWPAMRINTSKHPRQGTKYRVWPLMNFSVSVDDMESGMTHILRAKDHADNALRQEWMYKYFNKPIPETLFVGLINFLGLRLSTSETRKRIDAKEFNGWEDIRLPYLQALRRRGYKPDAFIKYALSVGVTKNDKSVDIKEFFKQINAFNKDVIEPISNRYFFVENPVKITIKGAPKLKVKMELHPDFPKRGKRLFHTDAEFYVAKQDYESFKDCEMIRLMDCLNFKKEKDKFIFISTDYEEYKQKGKKIIHWLPKNSNLIKVKLLMPDNKRVEGLGEEKIKELSFDAVVQLERVGFCRLDSLDENSVTFWYGHK